MDRRLNISKKQQMEQIVESMLASDDFNKTQEEIDKMNDKELAEYEDSIRELRIAQIRLSHMNYEPKKHFGVEYKKKRKRKRQLTKTSRRANRK